MATIVEALAHAAALQQSGRLREAEAVNRAILAQDARQVDALNNLGNLWQEQQQFVAAIGAFQQALELLPNSPHLHYNLANAHRANGDEAQALAGYLRAIACAHDFAPAHNNLGTLYKSQGDLANAERALLEAVRNEPCFADAYYNLGSVRQDRKDLGGAREAYLRSIELRPDFPEAHYNLGIVYQAERQWNEAARCFEAALRLRANYAQPHCNLGIMRMAIGDDSKAMSHFEQALAIDPACPEAHHNLGILLLRWGRFAEGWPEYAWKASCPRNGVPTFSRPAWDGAPLAGQTLLVHCHNGLGDTLNFVRYLVEIRRRGAGRILLAAQERLHPLLADAALDCELVSPKVIDFPESVDYDLFVSVTDLPLVLRTSNENLPPETFILKPRASLVDFWRARLAHLQGFRVGIAWQGNPVYPWDHLRSFPLSVMEPIARVPGVQLVSMQHGLGREQLSTLKGRFDVAELSDVDREGAFLDTSAIVANLDLVISNDSSLVHVAGAISAPCWLALHRGAEWRWGRGVETTPWYSSLRLFRQEDELGWDSLFDRMAAELPQFIAAVSPRLRDR
jgi:tetratricopeptide (TPR) repeat protein